MRSLSSVISISLLVGISLGSSPMVVKAQIAAATTDIDGLTCPFCSFGAKKRLKTVDGVGKVAVDVENGIARLQANPGESIQVSQIPEAVKKAGFSPGAVRIVAIGQIQQHGAHLHLHLKDQPDHLVLATTNLAQEQALLALADQKFEIEVTGLWAIADAESYARLTPEAIREL